MMRKLMFMSVMAAACLWNTEPVYGASFGDMFSGKKKQEEQKQVQECQMILSQQKQELQRWVDKNKDADDIIQGLRDKNSTLMEAYEKIVMDQGPITEQLNRLRRNSQRCEQIEADFERMNQENEAFIQENESLETDKASLRTTLDSLKSHIGDLTSENEQLKVIVQEAQEDDEIKMRKIKDKVYDELNSLKRDKQSLQKESTTLSRLLKEYEKKANLLTESNLKLQQQVEYVKGELSALQGEHTLVKTENRHLAQEASEFPKKFADLARHNQKLVKETAYMHYNMGVSFIKSKDYKRAVNEFKKVLELKPDDAYASYNLGYIYAEHLVDRQSAIKYFQDYLTYAKDARDADWVKKYILTWQTWYGKEKLK